MQHEAVFEVDGVTFYLRPLKLEDAMSLYPTVAETILPAVFSGSEGDESSIAGVVKGLKDAHRIMMKFAAVSHASVPTILAGKKVPVAGMHEQIFARNPARVLGFLTECLLSEFGPLVGSEGRAVLAALGSRFASLLTPIGSSGDSQQTNE